MNLDDDKGKYGKAVFRQETVWPIVSTYLCKNSNLIENKKNGFSGNAVSMGPFGESARLFLLGLRPPIFGT